MIDTNELNTLLVELKNKYRELLIANDKVVKYNPDKLKDNINPVIEQTEEHIYLKFILPVEWKYIEYGSKPHFPNVEALKQWAEQKPIKWKDDNGDEISSDAVAYLAGKKIAIEGIPATPLLQEAITQCNFYNRCMSIAKNMFLKEYKAQLLRTWIGEL